LYYWRRTFSLWSISGSRSRNVLVALICFHYFSRFSISRFLVFRFCYFRFHDFLSSNFVISDFVHFIIGSRHSQKSGCSFIVTRTILSDSDSDIGIRISGKSRWLLSSIRRLRSSDLYLPKFWHDCFPRHIVSALIAN